MLFSIITPVCNVQPYLVDMLESVRRQTCGDWEHILIDDGSTDGSGDVLDEYAACDLRFKVIHQANAGVSVARNKALCMASGEWFFFLDADDVLKDDCLSYIKNCAMSCPNADLVSVGVCKYDDGDKILWHNDSNAEIRQVDVREKMPADVLLSHFFSYAIKREIARGVEFPLYCVGEDRVYLAKILGRASSVVLTRHSAYGYRQRVSSVMHVGMTSRKLRDRIGYSFDWLETLTQSKKDVPRNVYKCLCNNLTESFVYDLWRLPRLEQRAMWTLWYDMLKRVWRYSSHFPAWTQFVCLTCHYVQWRWLASLLCGFPHFLKRLGLHRGVFANQVRNI